MPWRPAWAPLSNADRLASRLYIVAGLLLLVSAVYVWLAPLQVHGQTGPPFRCGTVQAPQDGELARSVCGPLVDREALKAVALLTAAAVAGLLAPVLLALRWGQPIQEPQTSGGEDFKP